MAYQQNLGAVTEADVRALVSAPSWADVSAAALTRFKATEGLPPQYTLVEVTASTSTRYGPGTVYGTRREVAAGTELTITGQYGKWLLTSSGDYILKSNTKEGMTDARIRAAISAATPKAIKEIIDNYDFAPTGISMEVVRDILTKVVNRIVFHATQALGGTPDR